MRRLYSLGWLLALPLALGYLLYRSRRQPGYRRHWLERFGIGRPVPGGGRPIWIHAVSVGETAAAAALIRRLAGCFPDAPILLTHTTPTGRETGKALLGDLGPRLRQCYLPYDLPSFVVRFLRTYRPRCGLIMEAEVWPNLMHAAGLLDIPIAVVNARLSDRSLARGLRYQRLIRPAIDAFCVIVAQSEADSARMAQLARPADAVTGNLKFDQAVSAQARVTGRRWRESLGDRPIVLLASSRDGEEALLLASWQKFLASGPLLVIVPRHPDRFEAVAELMKTAMPTGRLLRREALDRPDAGLAGCDLLLGDSMGEMQAWYACADVAIMGGSLLAFGSQNLIEANALGCPVILGQSTFNFEQAAAESLAAGASIQVADSDAAVTAANSIAADPARRAAMSQAALQFAQAHRGATERTLAALQPLLQRCRDTD
ncbi:MAG: 3-deoxy-D-manno-octulosonic acid transferase [Lautropia sp.]